MPQSQLSASLSEIPEIPALHALPAPRPPQPGQLTRELSDLICKIIQLDGISDASAGALAGVSHATLAKWKAANEEFAVALTRARARFEQGLMRAIKDARKRDGSPDWRAQAWVLQHASADGFVKPARSAKGRSANPENAADQKHANVPETPRTAAPPAKGAGENTPEVPETPSRPAQPAAPTPGSAAPADEKPSFLPETPGVPSGTRQESTHALTSRQAA